MEVEARPRGTVRFDSAALGIRGKLKGIISPDSALYKPFKAVYDRLYKKR